MFGCVLSSSGSAIILAEHVLNDPRDLPKRSKGARKDVTVGSGVCTSHRREKGGVFPKPRRGEVIEEKGLWLTVGAMSLRWRPVHCHTVIFTSGQPVSSVRVRDSVLLSLNSTRSPLCV